MEVTGYPPVNSTCAQKMLYKVSFLIFLSYPFTPLSNDDMSAFGSSTVWLALLRHSGWRLTNLPSMMLNPRYLIFFV